MNDPNRERFSHVVIACEESPDGLDQITGGCQVTLLQYGHEGSSRNAGGLAVIGYGKDDWKQVLTEIEV